jgi:uncharacterized protein (TIGR00297 family)
MPALTRVPTSDWLLGLMLLAGMIILLGLTERLYRLYPQRAEALRKFIHIITGAAVLPAPWLFTSWLPIFIITMFFAMANFWSIQRGKLKSIHEVSRPSFGTVYYPLAFAILLLAFWDWNFMILSIALALMAFADAVAGIVASKIPNRKILPLPWDKKSLQGSAAMLVCSALIIGSGFILFRGYHDLSLQHGFIIAMAIGLLATAAEALSYRGSDNLTVPLLAALGLYVILQPEMQQQFLLGEILALIITSLAFAAKALDLSGTIAAFLIGTIIFGIGGWTFAIPLLLFFIGSSILSRLPQRDGAAAKEMIAKSGRRDAAQVLANGLLPTLVVIASLFIKKETAFLLYLGGIAAAAADTWATEIGLLFGKQPRSILNGKKVAAGTSGGITLAGVVGAILGAAMIAFTGWWSYGIFEESIIRWLLFVGIAIAGIVAQFIDSLLGATMQRRNQCAICGQITERDEHCGQPTNYFSGWWWLDNDGVNVACGLSGIVCSGAFRHLL